MGLKSERIGRQEVQVGTGGFNGVSHGEGFVRGQIIHDDDVSGRKLLV